MSTVPIQSGTWPGWPGGVVIELETEAASAILTAARDYEHATGRNLHGDYGVLPCGGLRTPEQIKDMQWAFDHKGTALSNALYQKYNMDRASRARPATNSTHLAGRCLDIADNGFLAWLKAGNARRYGLTFPLVNLNDLRHSQYTPGAATVALDVSLLTESKGRSMIGIIYTPKNRAGTPADPDGYNLAAFDRTTGEFFEFNSDIANDALIAGGLLRSAGYDYVPGYTTFPAPSAAPGKVPGSQYSALKAWCAARAVAYAAEVKTGATTVNVDVAALATAIAAKLPASVTKADVQAATETAVRNVLGTLDGK